MGARRRVCMCVFMEGGGKNNKTDKIYLDYQYCMKIAKKNVILIDNAAVMGFSL
jgi:hypothetical protein